MAAGTATKSDRAAKEKARREEIKLAKQAAEKAGMDPDTKLTPDQRRRAAAHARGEENKTLSGEKLAQWILQGDRTPADAKAELEQLDKRVRQSGHTGADKKRAKALAEEAGVDVPAWAGGGKGGASKNGGQRRARDPEAADLAKAAAARAPEVKSAFLPKDARSFIDEVLGGRKAEDLLVGALPAKEEGDEGRDLDLPQLEKFAVKGEKDAEVRAFLRDLGKGTRLWGRKLGLFMVEQIHRDRA